MPSTTETALPTELASLIDRFNAAAMRRLKTVGELKTESGSFVADSTHVSFASAVGGKVSNEDYVASIKPTAGSTIQWAAAIADGVSGSFLGGVAAELACTVALAAVVGDRKGIARKHRAFPIVLVNRLLQRIGYLVETNPAQFCPKGVPVSIWNRAITIGKFLQTTLTVLWQDECRIQVLTVGDGGILYSQIVAPEVISFHKFGGVKLECIGPKNVPRNVEAYQIDDWNSIACFTDGLNEVAEQVKEFSDLLFRHSDDAAADAVKHVDQQYAELIEDNVSVVRMIKAAP
jgi:serine/threonine protein phosphatase PrpC